MIRIARNLMVGGCLRLAISVGAVAMAALPAWADYQSGVDAYYKGDFKAAYDAWLPLAEAGDAVAQNSLGALYDHGLGVPEDNAEAARWYEMAAQQGMPLAMRNLGNQYATGHGVPYDINLAQQWYEKAAALGDQQSAALLAHLRPATTPPVDTAVVTPQQTFGAPTTTGNLAEPVDDGSQSATLSGSAATDDSLVIPDAPAPAPVAAAPSSDAPIALDLGNNKVTMPATSEATAPAQTEATPPAPTPAAVQQAAVTPAQPPAARADGNWLIGQWQGPSLGCPKGGGIEFTEGETLSWFDGQVAVRLTATYQVSGDNIVVNAAGSDGAPQQYTYQRSGPDKMIIVSIPQAMPKSLLGIAYRRCGAAPNMTPSVSAEPAAPAAPATIPIIGGGTGEAPVLPASTQPATATQPAVAAAAPAPTTPAPAPAAAPTQAAPATGAASQYSLSQQANLGRDAAANNDKVASGWAAFEQGNYQEALTTFKSQADAGNTNMQVLVGNMYDYGQGVPQDDVQALQWYLMAASKGDIKGQYQAANLYFSSPTVPKNNVEAYRWASLAAKGPAGDRTSIWAQQLLSVLTANMTEDEIDDAKSLAKKPLNAN
ncbi:MAG: sel1 repeat family protein [Proteobacteria bacterium]|nr:sel1 repeat family protein [Pseudomonadota bacterium]